MIPTDLAARLRLLAEASFFDSEPPIQGTSRVREIQARLPQLLPGQQFTAHITRALPDNTFQAVVAGRDYTLALNSAAKPGDTLELVVTRNTANAIFARVVGDAEMAQAQARAPGAGAEASRPQLSPTGRLISFLLTGQPTPQPASLAAGRPLLPAPPGPNGGAELAPMLREALSRSGLFYEAHQARWLSGRTGTEALRAEPQGQQPPLGRNETATAPRVAPTPMMANAAAARASEAVAERVAAETQQTAQSRGPVVADRLMPVVHQQLDAMATQQYVLHGQAWPGQRFEWEVFDPRSEDGGGGEHDDGEDWDSTLRLTMPRLGALEARVHLTPAGVAIRLIAEDESTAGMLQAASGRLDEALAAADVPLTGFVAEVRDGS